MVDRQPQHAGRVHLEPVNGQQNTFDMTMADGATEQGTALNKANLLKDETLDLFRISHESVVDDVFKFLGRYNKYHWNRRAIYTTYSEKRTRIPSNPYRYTKFYKTGIVYKSSSINISSVDGSVSLVDPQPVFSSSDLTPNTYYQSTTGGIKRGTYDEQAQIYTGIIYVSTFGRVVSGTSEYAIYDMDDGWFYEISSISGSGYGAWQLLNSTNRNAYPDSGIQDGYEYEYIGVPFENLPTAPKIETGSYVGTGTYGASNPNSITFSFVPKFVMIWAKLNTSGLGVVGAIFNTFNVSNSFVGNQKGYFAFGISTSYYGTSNSFSKVDGNTLSWYHSTDADWQLNKDKVSTGGNTIEYHWLAIG